MNIANNEELVKSENIVNHERYIQVPRGWNRCLENGSIVYFSPSQICLRSKEDIARYLISDRTCKCGLDCPLYIDKVFDFDASLPSRHFKLTNLENDHKTLCRETLKARFATLAQTQTVIKTEVKEGNKPVIIKKKSELSVLKKKTETPKLPSFETFVSLADANPSQNLPDALTEEPKAKKPRKPVSQKKKSNATVTSALPTARSPAMPTCQTVHTNTTPILHSSVDMQTSKDAIPKTLQYPTVSSGALFGTSEQQPHHPQNVGSLFTFPSTQLNASSFLASLSSTTTISSRTRTGEVSHVQTVHPLRPFTTKSAVEHAPFGHKPAVFPSSPNQPNNVVYLSSTGALHSMPKPNSVNWPGTTGIPLSRLPHGNQDTTSLEKSKGGFTMKGKESLPKMVYPYPAQVPGAKPMMSTSSTASKGQLKQQDLTAQLVQKNTKLAEAALPGHMNTKIPSTDKHNNTRTTIKPAETLNQPLHYCGILLQPGMVPQVQLAGAGARPGVGNSQEQNPYGNLYTLQGLPYGSNVANPTVLGMPSNTVIPYFLGIAQPGNAPKHIIPASTSTNTTKESSPTCSTAPVSTSAIAAAYSAFVSIAPASVTTSSFSQQLVNLVSNYNNPYWQQLLTQGGNSNTLAYQLMQIGQYANTRLSSSAQTTKSSGSKSSSQNQTKFSTSSSRSFMSSSQESKPKIATKDSGLVASSVVSTVSSGTTTSCAISTSTVVTNTTVTAASEAKEGKNIAITSKPSISYTVSAGTSNDTILDTSTIASTSDSLEVKSACTISEASTNDILVAKLACTSRDTVPSTSENLVQKMDCTSTRPVDSLEDNLVEKHSSSSSKRVASITNILASKCACPDNETVDSTKDISTDNVSSTNSEILALESINKSPQRSASTGDKTVASMNDNLTEKSTCSNTEMLNPISNNSREKHGCSSSREDSTSNDVSEEITPCTSVETDALPKENLAESFENNPALTDTVIHDSSEKMCEDNAMYEDNTFTDIKPSLEASRDPTTQSITEKSSATEVADMASVSVDADSVKEHENMQAVDACTSEGSTVTSEQVKLECGKVKTSEHEKLECEKVETENTPDEFLNVTTNSELIKKECMDVTSESGNGDNKVATASSDCQDNICGNDDSTTIDVVLGEKIQNNRDVKTDLVKDKDVKTDLLKETRLKTDTLEMTDDKTNSLKDNAQEEIRMEPEETSNRLSSKRNYDRAVKIKVKEDLHVGREIKNGEAERMSNDTESTKEVRSKEVCEAVEFTIGDIVWAQARGLPSWPGKIVDERDVGHGKAAADIGKKWVMWFGDHTFSQVEIEKLKTLTDGLKTLDDKGRKRKYRGKKTRIGLEQAISEALEELDKRERLRSRQGTKAKKRRL